MIMRTDAADTRTREIALRLQYQVAAFLAWDGAVILDPDDPAPVLGGRPIFEVPITDADRDGTSFIPSPCPP
jgi:hypothetical protein